MANILRKQYESVFSDAAVDSSYFNTPISPNIPTIGNIKIEESDIVEAIDELSNTSSSGPDGIPVILLKMCKDSIKKPLLLLYRKLLDEGTVPAILKIAHIIPIHKGGHQGLAANYRPISLTSHLIKILEKIIRNQLVKFLEENNLFNPGQHGFRQGRSCLSQLLSFYEDNLRKLESGANVDIIYLDFAKAFDKVDHKILMRKLQIAGVNGKLLEWIESFLDLRYQMVVVNGNLSEPSLVKSGVPQGSVIGPLLFLVLIADIDAKMLNAVVSSFADDTRASKDISSRKDATDLQDDLDRIYQWAVDNNMQFNDLKFELLRLGYCLELKEATEYLNPSGQPITEKEHVKDLGVTMSNSGSFSEHIDKICTSARNMCSWILRTFKSRSPELMLTTWKSLVLPILDYCSQLWCPIKLGQIKQLEAIQQSFTRKIDFNGRKLDYWERLKELRLYSLERRRERYRIIYVWKILENMVPNVADEDHGGIKKQLHSVRIGVKCKTPTIKASLPKKVAALRESSITYHGANLFNILPKSIRDTSNCPLTIFKKKLDGYLSSIKDQPRVIGYTGYALAESNSLLTMIHFSRGNASNAQPTQPPSTRCAPAPRW